jgi:hypothetical protein
MNSQVHISLPKGKNFQCTASESDAKLYYFPKLSQGGTNSCLSMLISPDKKLSSLGGIEPAITTVTSRDSTH